MREAIGGSWIFGIVALFIVLFSSFIAYSISYTKAFKTKNEIINYIEKNEGFTQSGIDDMTIDQIRTLKTTDALAYLAIQNMGYNTEQIDCSKYGVQQRGGYCVARYCVKNADDNQKVYYKVTTFIKIKIPVINLVLQLPIMGETKSLYFEQNNVIGCYSYTDNVNY